MSNFEQNTLFDSGHLEEKFWNSEPRLSQIEELEAQIASQDAPVEIQDEVEDEPEQVT